MKLNLAARLYQLLPVVLLRSAAKVTGILWRGQGYLRSVADQRCVDASGSPLPWYTYPSIEFLKQLDFSNKSVFEYGSGYSTLFWGGRAREVVSVEHSPEWFDIVKRQLPANCRVMLEVDPAAYVRAIELTGQAYDVVVVDGLVPKRARAQCSVLAVRHLAPGGMIVLDNSDYLPGSTELLRMAGLIQVDLSGFGPCNDHVWTTSLFLARDYAFQPIGGRQPHAPIGGLGYNWEPGLERLLKGRMDLPALLEREWRRASAEHLLSLVTMPPPENEERPQAGEEAGRPHSSDAQAVNPQPEADPR